MKTIKILVFIMLISILGMKGHAQNNDDIVQFSGIVVAGDSLFGITGAHMINLSTRIGYVSSESGYFSFPAEKNDTILITFVGFHNKYVIIPSNCQDNKYTMIVKMAVDTTNLGMIEVLPYPTVELFKEAFVHLELPEDELLQNMNRNLNQKRLRRMFENMDMTASMNYKHYTQEQIKRYETKGFVATTQLMNPLAWINFIRAIANGDFKREDDDDE